MKISQLLEAQSIVDQSAMHLGLPQEVWDKLVSLIPNLLVSACDTIFKDIEFWAVRRDPDVLIDNIHNYFGGDIRYPEGPGYEKLVSYYGGMLRRAESRTGLPRVQYTLWASRHPEFDSKAASTKRLMFLVDEEINKEFYSYMIREILLFTDSIPG